METESKILELINNSDLNQMRKNIFSGTIKRFFEVDSQRQEAKKLIEELGEKKLSKVLLSNDDVKIYSVNGEDEWDVKYPFRSIFFNRAKNRWEKTCIVSPSFDLAYICYLERKYLGENSNFTFFAMKMLGIEDVE